MSQSTQRLFVEVFPVQVNALPHLTAYRLLHNGAEASRAAVRTLGARLAITFAEMFGGTWVFTRGRIVTENAPNPVKLLATLQAVKAENARALREIDGIEEDFEWDAAPDALADYILRGPIATLEGAIRETLLKTVHSIRRTRTHREYRLRSWIVADAPALSISVISRLLYEPDLQAYAETLTDPQALIGLQVVDKISGSSGEIVKIAGQAQELRDRLLSLTENDAARALITEAPADHWVVRVLVGARELDYVTDALDLVIRPEDITQFDINRAQLEKALYIKPAAHAQLIKIVSDVLKDTNLISGAFSTDNAPQLFHHYLPEMPRVQFADERPRAFQPNKLFPDYAAGGDVIAPKLTHDTIRVAVINTLSETTADFLEAWRRTLERDHKLKLDVVRERNMRVITPVNLESAVRLLHKENADVFVVFLPDDADAGDDEGVNERYARAQIIGRGLPCLIITESAMNDAAAMPSISMGLKARAGFTPYTLVEPFPFADRVVGVNIIETARRLIGLVRVYKRDGALLDAVIAEADADDLDALFAALFMRSARAHLTRQRVVLHVDGRLSRAAARALGSIEDELNATFMPVEIIRAGVPRLYAVNKGIEPPAWGSAFRLSDSEAFVQASNTSVQPLHIRCEPPLTIEQAVASVLTFTLFHYGAGFGVSRPSKFPVTIQGGEALEQGITRGVFPTDQPVRAAFWL